MTFIHPILEDPETFANSTHPLEQLGWMHLILHLKEATIRLPAQQLAGDCRSTGLLLGPPGTETYMISWMIVSYMVACMSIIKKSWTSGNRRICFCFTRLQNVLSDIVERLELFRTRRCDHWVSARFPWWVIDETGGKQMFTPLGHRLFGATSWTS